MPRAAGSSKARRKIAFVPVDVRKCRSPSAAASTFDTLTALSLAALLGLPPGAWVGAAIELILLAMFLR